VPSAKPASLTRLVVVVVLAMIAIPVAYLAGRAAQSRLVTEEWAPTGGRVAFVMEGSCSGGSCQSLWIGVTRDSSTRIATLRETDYCDEIAWSPDGARVGFLVNGHQFRLFNPQSLAPAGQLSLIVPEGTPTVRIARGITFSENGRAVTFDDCPRTHSGCRSGLVGLPQEAGRK
jgi:hypothetical protein